jgi:hypothetical protein
MPASCRPAAERATRRESSALAVAIGFVIDAYCNPGEKLTKT